MKKTTEVWWIHFEQVEMTRFAGSAIWGKAIKEG